MLKHNSLGLRMRFVKGMVMQLLTFSQPKVGSQLIQK
jgi:hypothetical protein